MKKKNKNSNKNLIILIVIAVLAVGAVIYSRGSRTNTLLPVANIVEQKKAYGSKNLKLSLQIPIDWKTEENISFIDLIHEDEKINISRIATNFLDVSSYLQDFDSKRTIRTTLEKNLTIGGFRSVSRIESFDGGPISQQKAYYIYVDGWVYSISTSSQALFGDLDQIAQSFRYTP